MTTPSNKRGCPTCNGVDPKSCLRCRGKTRLSDWNDELPPPVKEDAMTTPTPLDMKTLPFQVSSGMCAIYDGKDCGGADSPCTCYETHAYFLKMQSDLAAAQEWKERVLDELIVAHIYTKEHDTNPKKAIHDAIVWNCQVAIDPAVSSDARKLIAQERERCAKVCEEQEAVGNIDDLSYEIATVECAAAIRRGS